MLYLVTWRFINTSEASLKRLLDLFATWKPPVEQREFHAFADGSGGMALVETDSAATLARLTAPWAPWLEYTVKPLVPLPEMRPVLEEAVAFRAAVPAAGGA